MTGLSTHAEYRWCIKSQWIELWDTLWERSASCAQMIWIPLAPWKKKWRLVYWIYWPTNCVYVILQTVLNKCQHELKKCQTPMLTISMFLSELFLNHSLPTGTKTVQRSTMRVAGQMSNFLDCSQVLHSCPGFTQNELIPLILSIFDGIPKPFQIFRCQSSSLQEELDLFLQRATKFAIPHLILEVNKLPFQLQEVSFCDITCGV